MVNIEIRQNGKFELGFPYNSSVDSYFKHLPAEFVSNYNLSSVEVQNINNHKNETLAFDRDLYEFVIKLSAFIKGFEIEGQTMIDTYNLIKSTHNTFQAQLDIIKVKYTKSTEKFNYIETNLAVLEADLIKINEFIRFYESQLIEETYLFNASYILDTETRLSMIDNIITDNDNNNVYYQNVLNDKVIDYVTKMEAISPYDFDVVSLKALYEAWQLRTEDYYTNLVSYFADDYNNAWTYGQSIMYDENNSYVAAAKSLVVEISSNVQHTLFKKYSFDIEKAVREYSLVWLTEHPTFEPIEFTIAVETKRFEIINEKILVVDDLIKQKAFSVKSVISTEMYNDYFKYQEYIQAKRKYIFMNIMGTIDLEMITYYDGMILNLRDNYLETKAKFEQKTYWMYYFELENHRELLNDLNRQREILSLAVSREFQRDSGSNDLTNEKIEYYMNEHNSLVKKIDDMIHLKDKVEIENNVYSDESTLLNSKIFEQSQKLIDIIALYRPYFVERIAFFTQNITHSEMDGVIDLMNGHFYKGFVEKFENIKNYTSNVMWYNIEDKNTLIDTYEYVITILVDNLKKQWDFEFNQDIIASTKFTYYNYYFDNELVSLYGRIHHFILQQNFDEIIYTELVATVTKINQVFHTYVDIAFEIGQDIEVSTDIFNYDRKFDFKISKGIEQKEDIIKTFGGFLTNILEYVNDKNIEYKTTEIVSNNQLKIDTVWNDMEKKYV